MTTIEEAEAYLKDSVRQELRDHAFGDAEVLWYKDGNEVANGYFSGSQADISVPFFSLKLKGDEARKLRYCGVEGRVDRNDETGPANFSEGTIMPGLTKEAVFEELTTPPIGQNFYH